MDCDKWETGLERGEGEREREGEGRHKLVSSFFNTQARKKNQTKKKRIFRRTKHWRIRLQQKLQDERRDNNTEKVGRKEKYRIHFRREDSVVSQVLNRKETLICFQLNSPMNFSRIVLLCVSLYPSPPTFSV